MSKIQAPVGSGGPELLGARFQRERPTAARRVADGLRGVLREFFTAVGTDQGQPWTHVAQDLARMFQAAVEENIVVVAQDRDLREHLIEEKIAMVLESLPTFGGTEPAKRDAMVDALASYAEELLVQGFLGYVIYRGADASAYSYVLRKVTALRGATAGRKSSAHVVREDLDAPYGQRRTFGWTQEFRGKARHDIEEHVHHLRDSKEVFLRKFTEVLPPRVAALVQRIPARVQPYLRVMGGTIVQEEIHTREEATTTLTTKITETHKVSPAITLGDLVLTGWSSDDYTSEKASGGSGFKKKLLLTAGLVALGFVLPPAARLVLRVFRGW